MTFAGKIRSYLIAVALLPPVIIMLVVYFGTVKQLESSYQTKSYERLQSYRQFDNRVRAGLKGQLKGVLQSPIWQKALIILKSGKHPDIEQGTLPLTLDFLEILDNNKVVLWSYHRPGLVGENLTEIISQIDTDGFAESIEYDRHGPHAAMCLYYAIDSSTAVYSGMYVDETFAKTAAEITSAEAFLVLDYADAPDGLNVESLSRDMLHESNDKYYSLLNGGKSAGFYLVAEFIGSPEKSAYQSLLQITGIVAGISVLTAILLGIFISGRARKEIDNLVDATTRVADGDFGTTVMAYEEGEFSQLADSFSTMISKLQEAQKRLATSEKIAAWQVMGRKVAHEIKNPLTPIEISTDDLRVSYKENRPDFDKVLTETTSTIKSEINRMKKLLDQFSSFARMSAPNPRTVNSDDVIQKIEAVYRSDIESGKLIVQSKYTGTLLVDSDQIHQLLINLIKNGLESSEKAAVTVTLSLSDSRIKFAIEDTGPGFAKKILEHPFEPYVSTKTGGSGLGLVICQRIVHDHDGLIELYRPKKGGAGVVILLPRKDG